MEENRTIPKLAELPEVLTVPEVARVLRISAALVRKLLHEGRLAGLNTGGRQLVAKETLSRFLAAGPLLPVSGPLTEAVKKGRHKERN